MLVGPYNDDSASSSRSARARPARSVRDSDSRVWIVPWRCWCTGLRRDSFAVGADAGVGRAGPRSPRSALVALVARCGTSADRRGLGVSGGGGAGLVASLRRVLQGGACGIHPVVSGAGPNLVLFGLAGTD
jgi:hypothetical protein